MVPKDYGGIAHGVCRHVPRQSGKDRGCGPACRGQESFAAANKEQFYVSVSRGREALRLYTDDKAAMLEAVKGSGARLSASELIGNPQPKSKPRVPLMQRLFRVQQIQRTFRAVRERVAASWIKPNQKEVSLHARSER